jgi:phospholipid transport system substrate-binding protein
MKRYFVGLSFFIFLLSALPAYADGPLDTVRQEIKKVLDVLGDSGLNKEVKRERLGIFYGQMFDEVEFSKRALGGNWRKLNPAQQQEFVRLFRGLLEKAYIDKLLAYTDEKILFGREITLASNRAQIQTKVITSSREIPIDYRVIRKDGMWKVYDVVVENVSLVQNYRSQFRSILAKNTPDQLLELLRKKVKGK